MPTVMGASLHMNTYPLIQLDILTTSSQATDGDVTQWVVHEVAVFADYICVSECCVRQQLGPPELTVAHKRVHCKAD